MARRAFMQQHMFGDFEFDPFGLQPMTVDRLRDRRGEMRIAHLRGRKVDRDPQILRPIGGLGDRLAHHPFADRHDQAGLFRDRQEVVGRDHPAHRMIPAQQRFVTRCPPALEIDHRLVVQPQFATRDRFGQILFELALVARLAIELVVVDRQIVAALALRREQREVGAPHQFLRIAIAFDAARHADTGRHAIGMPFDLVGLAHHRQEAVRAFDQHARAEPRIHQHGEFVAPQPRDQIVVADFLFQPDADFAQQAIADAVATRVVDRFEIVEIEIEQRDVRAFVECWPERAAQALVEAIAIGEPGEAVVMRHESDAFFVEAIRGDVARDAGGAPVGARCGGQAPEAQLAIYPQFDRQIAKRGPLDQIARQRVARLARAEQTDQRCPFERGSRCAERIGQMRRDIAQIAARADRP